MEIIIGSHAAVADVAAVIRSVWHGKHDRCKTAYGGNMVELAVRKSVVRTRGTILLHTGRLLVLRVLETENLCS